MRRRRFDVAVQPFEPGFLQALNLIFGKDAQGGAEMKMRFLSQELKRFADFLYTLLVQGAPAGDKSEACSALRFRFQGGFEAGFRADPGESLAACLPVRRLSAPLAVFRA